MKHPFYTLFTILSLPIINLYNYAIDKSTFEIAPGISYTSGAYAGSDCLFHVATVDPQHASLHLELAHEKWGESETVSSIAARNNARVAVNAHFFDFGTENGVKNFFLELSDRFGLPYYNAYPLYGCKMNGRWYSLPQFEVGAVGWHRDHKAHLYDTLKVTAQLLINGHTLPIANFNQPGSNEPTLYTSAYGDKTPWFYKGILKIIVQNNHIAEIVADHRGTCPIPLHGFVYTVPHDFVRSIVLGCKKGDIVQLRISASGSSDTSSKESQWKGMDYILGSTPLLVHNNAIVPHDRERHNEFYTRQYPRTAIGTLKNGHWVLVTADSPGCTIAALASFMHALGCENALNLQGGRHSCMVVDHKVVSKGVAGKERPVATALIVKSK